MAQAAEKHGPRAAPRWALTCAIGGGLLVLGGVIRMTQPDDSVFPALPAGFMRDIFPNPVSVIDGTVLVLVGLLLIGCFLPDYIAAFHRSRRGAGPHVPRLAGGWPRARVRLLAGGALLYLISAIGALTHTTRPLLLACLILALVLLTIAVAAQPGKALETLAGAMSRWEIVFVAATIAAFMAFALSQVGDWRFTYWGDEWPFYAFARQIATGWAVDPFSQAGVYGIHPFADSIYQGLVMRVTGLDATAWRLSSIVATAVPIAPLYVLGRQLAGPLFAAVAVAIYAGCPLLWSFARIGYNNDDPLLCVVLAIMLLYSGIRGGSAGRLVAAGVCAGAGWYSIYTGRLAIGVLIAVLITEWGGGWAAWWRRLACVLTGFAVTILPLAIDNGLDIIRLMAHNTPLSTTHNASEYFQLVGHNLVRALYAFVYSTANDHYVFGAIFDPVAAAILLVGLALAFRRIASLEARLLLIWYAATLFLTTPFNDAEGVSLTRSMIVAPAAALLAASGLCAYWSAVQRFIPARPRLMSIPGVAAALIASLAFNLHQNYVVMPDNLYPPYPRVVLLIKAIRESPDTTFILPADMPSIEPNNQFCAVMQGYGILSPAVLYPSGVTLIKYCPNALSITPRASIELFRGSETAARACGSQPSETLSMTQGTVWSFRIKPTSGVAATYTARVLAAALATCPSLFSG